MRLDEELYRKREELFGEMHQEVPQSDCDKNGCCQCQATSHGCDDCPLLHDIGESG